MVKKNQIKMKIEKSHLRDVVQQMRYSISKFEIQNVPKSEINILMPNYFITALSMTNSQNYSHYEFLPMNPYHKLETEKIFGMSIYPHYKNEVVVFCTNFVFYKKLDTPFIIPIEIQE